MNLLQNFTAAFDAAAQRRFTLPAARLEALRQDADFAHLFPEKNLARAREMLPEILQIYPHLRRAALREPDIALAALLTVSLFLHDRRERLDEASFYHALAVADDYAGIAPHIRISWPQKRDNIVRALCHDWIEEKKEPGLTETVAAKIFGPEIAAKIEGITLDEYWKGLPDWQMRAKLKRIAKQQQAAKSDQDGRLIKADDSYRNLHDDVRALRMGAVYAAGKLEEMRLKTFHRIMHHVDDYMTPLLADPVYRKATLIVDARFRRTVSELAPYLPGDPLTVPAVGNSKAAATRRDFVLGLPLRAAAAFVGVWRVSQHMRNSGPQ